MTQQQAPDPMCTCQHEEWRHDRNTGRCLAVVRDGVFCTCPCFVADPTEPAQPPSQAAKE